MLNDDDDLDRRPTTTNTKDRDRRCRLVMSHGFLPLSALGPPGQTQSLRLPGPFRWSGPAPGPKHNIGQDPSRTTTQTTPTATITKDLGLTTTMTDDDLNPRPTTTKDRGCHCMSNGFLVCQPSCRLLLLPSLSLSLSLSVRSRSSWSGTVPPPPRPFRWSGPVPGPKHNIGQDPSRATTKTTATTARVCCSAVQTVCVCV